MKNIAPNAPGPMRPFLARLGLLLTLAGLSAGLAIVGLIGLGYHPI